MFSSFVNSFLKEEDGQDMVEYCLLLAFIGLVGASVLSTINGNIKTLWTGINTKISNVGTPQ